MKILFITHDASRSGAPMMLLFLMQWLRKHVPDISFDMLYVHGGVMEPEFNGLCDEVFYIKNKVNKPLSLAGRIKRKLGFETKKVSVYEQLAKRPYHVIYANTGVSVSHGVRIKEKGTSARLIAHIHELEIILKTLVPNFNGQVRDVDHFIAVSEQVKANLLTGYQIDPNKISVVYGCALEKPVANKTDTVTKKSSFIVGASGLSYWRKGNDVFLQVARYLFKHYPELDVAFIWVGNEFRDKPVIDNDIKKMGLQHKVRFVGELEDPTETFRSFDVLLLPSREDPFPLVCIELAHLRKPIICFEGASGSAEVVKQGGGKVVPYLDIEAMAEAIVSYYNNAENLKQDGINASNLFKAFTPENICPILFEVINETLKH
ncbi:glycosyltransferase family 4 protein [Confluentibacter flavum]|uniref:Glycosyltransferase subfamily 4-like N-terminal domain-containing protein n=1 Tax=Confluentibacter flavum TaxID=1909700 RepID=A0A2N3HP03_9FLAO|nr:glycosyltransferase family 4 protein [Confluentibacter flavum]PKQ46713.1 hypothetical protein CSW08_01555 [Confluentibacter flavum]